MGSTTQGNSFEKHLDHLGQHHDDLAGRDRATRQDHDYLSHVRVIPTNSGRDIVSVPVPMTIKSQIGNPVSLEMNDLRDS